MTKSIRIGTRGSELALWQANFVKSKLENEGQPAELFIIRTQGDAVQHLSLDKLEGKGFFTSELEHALRENAIDLAVHSMKDLPTQSADDLIIAGTSDRENPADWLLINPEQTDDYEVFKLKRGAIVGTSSNRRKAQIRFYRPDIVTKDIRGNVPTRLQKLIEGQFDALLLAAAGLIRLQIDLSSFRVIKLHPREFIPAPAQGVLAYQVRRDDRELVHLVQQSLHHPEITRVTNVERKILRLLEGGCHLPLGAYCEKDVMGYYHVWAAYAPELEASLRFVTESYSTVDGLAEGVIQKLTL